MGKHLNLGAKPNLWATPRMNNDGTMRHAVLDHYDMERAFNCGCMMPYMDYTPRTLYEIMTAYGFKQL